MSFLNVGLIYAYRDPISYHWIYTGSIHNQNSLEGRHQGHLKGDLLFDTWLQFMKYAGQDIQPEIMQYVGYEHISRLFEKENEWMKRLGTLRAEGGLNRVLAGGPDRSAMGRLSTGGRSNAINKTGFCGRSLEKRIEDARKAGLAATAVKDEFGQSVNAKKAGCSGAIVTNVIIHAQKDADGKSVHAKNMGEHGGPIGGRSNAINKTGVCGRSPEKMSEDGRKAGSVSGPRVCHKRWHTDRGIVNPDCKLCQEEQMLKGGEAT
jgi:hypothetical protein